MGSKGTGVLFWTIDSYLGLAEEDYDVILRATHATLDVPADTGQQSFTNSKRLTSWPTIFASHYMAMRASASSPLLEALNATGNREEDGYACEESGLKIME